MTPGRVTVAPRVALAAVVLLAASLWGPTAVGAEEADGSLATTPVTERGAVDDGVVELAAPTATAVPAAAVDVIGGHLDWGFKESFRNYIVGPIARGSITPAGGAADNGDGTYRFPIRPGATYDHATSTAVASFGGSLSFRGHGYHHPTAGDLLQLTVSDLRIEVAGPTGTLYADVVSLELEGDLANPQPGGTPVTYDDVALVTLDFNGIGPVTAGTNGVQWIEVPSALGVDGAEAFAGFYPAGTAFDPVSYVLELEQVPAGIPDPPPPPAAPTASVDRTVVSAGEVVTVTGAGFLPGEQVEVWLQPTGGWQATAIAGGSGLVTHALVIPPATAAGDYTIELRGISSGLTMSSPAITVLAGASPIAFDTASLGRTALPATGNEERNVALAGGALILVGGALVLVARRTRREPLESAPSRS